MSTRALTLAGITAGAIIVLGQVDVEAFLSTGQTPAPVTGSAAGEFQAEPTGATGPDVIVGELPDIVRWATNGTEAAYSIATTSCNIGSDDLLWQQQPSNMHPVIGQNMFRLSGDGRRFEQVGQSWLKHAFCALQLDLQGCGDCPNSGGCLQHLEPGCADPYTASRNGSQNGLGPKWQVNASTGVYPIPYDQGEGTSGSYRRRLRVAVTDLDPALNPGAKYFVEGQYVTQDDAASGNQNNNASYAWISIAGPNYDANITSPTVKTKPGIYAWRTASPPVDMREIQVPNDGLYILGAKAYENGDGTWDYEYAVQNLNSDRSGRTFSVPVGDATITNMGFRDVDYHSGDGIGGVDYDGTDWSVSEGGGVVSWTTASYDTNEAANALRWGTMYNFRFTANRPPADGDVTLTLFKPGTPSSIDFPGVDVPGEEVGPCNGDLDGSGSIDFPDLLAVLAAWGPCVGCPEDIDGTNVVDFQDLLAILAAWGGCAE